MSKMRVLPKAVRRNTLGPRAGSASVTRPILAASAPKGRCRMAASAASAQHSSCLVLCASVAVGALVGLLLAFSGGLLDLALPAVALYQVAWAVPTLAIPTAKKY